MSDCPLDSAQSSADFNSPQGSSPDSGTSLSSRDATPAGRDQHKVEKEQGEEDEEEEEEEEESEEEESGEEEDEESEEEEEKEGVVAPASKKKPMFLLRRLVSFHHTYICNVLKIL